MKWYQVADESSILTPSLLVYPQRISNNIKTMLSMVGGDADRLRPHVKTYKMKEIVEMQMHSGISKFKCATIAEAEMLGQVSASDILLAYQPVGPNIDRLFDLVQKFPNSRFAALVDDKDILNALSRKAETDGVIIDLYIDLDVGMNRTGISPSHAFSLGEEIISLPGTRLAGLHAYDGHIRSSGKEKRFEEVEGFLGEVLVLRKKLEKASGFQLEIVAGGSPTFLVHAQNQEVNCSPGTVLLWDAGYGKQFPELPFMYAGLVATRIISKPGSRYICTDLGHKAVAADKPLPRVEFLNLPNAKVISQSEEHLVVEVDDNTSFRVGDMLYAVPQHICPTCALHMEASVISDNELVDTWQVISRNRKISI